MRHKSRQWITGILCAAMITSALPVYASEIYESDVPEVTEQEVVEENTDTYEISSAPETDEIADSDVITDAENAVGSGSLELNDAGVTFAERYGDDLTSLTLGTDYNSTMQLVIYQNDESMSTDDYTCISSDENVVKVYSGDYWYWNVEGVSAGTATITATNQNGESGTLTVTVLNSGEDGYLYQDAQGNVLEHQIYNNEIIITGYTKAKGSITIPSQIGGLNVTEIEGNAFSGCTSITKLTVSNGIRHIGNYAFGYCTGLISVELPETVEDIGLWAFEGCSGLTSFRIPQRSLG